MKNNFLLYSVILILLGWHLNVVANDKIEKKLVYIPAQPLAEALIDFSYEYNRVVVGIPKVLKQHLSREVNGTHTPYEALQIILSNTNLVIKSNKKNGYIVSTPTRTNDSEITLQSIEEFYEEIYVTGRGSNFQKKHPSVSIDSLTNNNNELGNAFEPSKLTLQSPNLYVTNLDEGVTNITLRGMRNFGNASQSTTPIAYHYNNHYIQATSISNLNLFDISTIHIAKGPQIANKGRNSISGSIYVEPKSAELNLNSAKLSIGSGSFGRQLIQSEINRSLSPEFSIRLATQHRELDGYTRILNNYDEIYDGPTTSNPPFNYPGTRFSSLGSQQNFDSRFEFNESDSWRLSGLWAPNDSFALKALFENHKISKGTLPALDPSFVNGRNRFVASYLQTQNNSDVSLFSASTEYKSSDYLFEYQYSFLSSDREVISSQGYQRSPFFTISHIPNESFHSSSHNISASNLENESYSWSAGILFDRSKIHGILYFDVLGYNEVGEPNSGISVLFDQPDFNNQSSDAYFNYTKRYTHFDLDGSLRYSLYTTRASNFVVSECDVNFIPRFFDESLNGQIPNNIFFSDNLLNGEQVNGSRDGIGENQRCHAVSTLNDEQTDDFLSFDASTIFKLNKNNNATIRYAETQRPGLVQSGGNIAPEDVKSVEARVFGQNQNINIDYTFSIFANRHKNMHAQGNRYADRDGDGDANDFLFTDTQNIAEANISGAELTLSYQDKLGGTSKLDIAYLDAKIEDYDAVDGVFFQSNPWNPISSDPRLAALGHSDLSGNTLPYSPRWSASLNYSYPLNTSIGSFSSRLILRYVDEYFLDLHNRDSITLSMNEESTQIQNLSRQKSYSSADFYLTWDKYFDGVSVDFFIENLTDTETKIGIDPRFYSTNGFSSFYSPPRTYGINLNVSF